MGINFDTTAASAIYKQRYTDKKIETLTFMSALVGMMPKDPNYGGAQYNGAIRNAVTTARSASDSTAFTSGTPSSYKQWQCQWAFDYASANITGSVIDQASGNANAMVDALVSEFDGAFTALGISLGGALFGNGGGAIGQISAGSTVGSTQITLANPSTVVNFQVGQILNAATTDGTSGSVETGSVTLTGVDVNSGVLTASANWSAGIGTIAAGDFLFNQGDFGAKMIGLAGWIPTTSPGGTAFNGVVRNTDPVRLAGVRYSGNGAPKSESLTQLATLVNRMGGRPDKLFCNPLDYADLIKELGSRVVYATDTAFGNPQIAFEGVKVATPYGMITIHQDVFCPQGNSWLLQMSTWLLPSMGKVPKVLGKDVNGLEWLRLGTSDAYQSRFGYRATSYCAAPGWNGVVTW